MKKLLFTLTLGVALAFGSHSAFAQAKKKPAAPGAAAEAAADPAKAADAAKAKADKPLPMFSRADEIDAAGKTFTQVNKDGKKVKHVVTDKTEIKNGEKDAKFEDIKVGDTVSGLRTKKSDSEYDVVKITKFGPAVKKPAAPKADAPKPKAN